MSSPQREFELAVRSFGADLYRFAFWLSRDRHVAEDLVQECFSRAWRGWEKLDDQRAVKQWLFKILRHEFLRRFERKRLDLVDIDDMDTDTMEMEVMYSSSLSVEDTYAVRQALAQAPVSLREPLLMQVLAGFSADELAVLNKTTPGAMTTRLSRARQWLRTRLDDKDGRMSMRPNGGSQS
jgi:RNA polymerase sigma-70 factor (ECF subfamily)